MLRIIDIKKQYKTGGFVQTALNSVSLNLRDNEFVAILGPSGSGKTTLLNIIGGLDQYDSGDLVINNVTTKHYKDRDWDSYRNHTIGFVFQSYNLIPHQNILANVELALTISGIKKKERRARAKEALEKVGLGEHIHKKPNQLSGGQMQRVAIARALVNNPDILLADEPTGALDSDTSVQVMELLKEIAKDRLVVMVTHNPELAEEYATRIVNLRDGKIISDTDPFEINDKIIEKPVRKKTKKTSMSFGTALALSFNNLTTKKARTFLTAIAGSIGIIGIALIISLSTGVNQYIADIQKETMISYPITIEEKTLDLTAIMEGGIARRNGVDVEATHEFDAVYSNGRDIERASSVSTSTKTNNLAGFKKYLDSDDCVINDYIGENGIVYSYNTKFAVYTYDKNKVLLNTDGSSLKSVNRSGGMFSGMAGMFSRESNNFEEILPGPDGSGISKAILDSYEVVAGNWPEKYNEVVLVLDENNEISATSLYQLGILPSKQYNKLIDKINDGEEITVKTKKLDYEKIMKKKFYLLTASDMYGVREDGLYEFIAGSDKQIEDLLENALKLKICGIIKPVPDADYAALNEPIAYLKDLTDFIIEKTADSEVVKAQEDRAETNILNGVSFSSSTDEEKVDDTIIYLEALGVSEKAAICKDMLEDMGFAAYPGFNPASLSETQLADIIDNYLDNPEDDVLLSIYDKYINPGSYDDNMATFGLVDPDSPATISLYSDSFENKDNIAAAIEDYNKTVDEDDQISYNDYVGLLMSSVTTIINVITYVLIAFVALSLVVSSIMIGIITYISVLERTKEIGILRAIGASKGNISQVFNAETFIIGLLSGVFGIIVTRILIVPMNVIVHNLTDSPDVNASLPWLAAVILIVLSVLLTLIGGLIPSKKAAKQDPVTALRTE